MALKLYFTNSAPTLSPGVIGAWNLTTGYVERLLSPSKSGANASRAQSETVATNNYTILLGSWVTEPFERAATIPVTDTVRMTVARDTVTVNTFATLWRIYVVKPDGSIRGTYFEFASTSAWGTNPGNGGVNPRSPDAPIDVQPGDRLVSQLGAQTIATTTTSQTATIWYGGTGTDFTFETPGDSAVTTKVGWMEVTGVAETLWTPPTTTTPTSVLDIGPVPKTNHFDIQLAVAGAGTIETHDQTEIGSGYKFYPWYYGNAAGDRCVLRAPVNGPVTSGSSSARCEHREVNADGTSAAFDATIGTHVMHGRSKITHAPPNTPDIVLAQLHNGAQDRLSFLTQLVTNPGGTWRLRFRLNGTSVAGELVPAGIANILNIEFEWKIEVINNVVRFYLNDMVTPVYTSGAAALTATAGITTWYFKCGCYLQTPASGSADALTEYGEVELRDLWHSHAAPQTEPGRRLLIAY